MLFVTKILHPQIGVELAGWTLGIQNHLLQDVDSPYHLVVSLNHYFVGFFNHSAHHLAQHLLYQILNLETLNNLKKNLRPSNLQKTLSFELDVSMYVLACVHLHLVKKHSDLQFFHLLQAKWGP